MVRTRSEDESTAGNPVRAPAGVISPVVDFLVLFLVVFVAALVVVHTFGP
jgi:hypothetical protein